jgi:hypothetical protein
MNSRYSCWTFGLLCTAMAASTIAQADSGPAQQVPDYYAGVGARGLKGDKLAGVVDAKIKLLDFEKLSLSIRPALLFGAYDDEWCLPLTVDGKVNKYGFAWFGGAGVAHGMDDLGETDAMVTGGIDLPFKRRWDLNVTINYLWQHAIDDVDGELLVTINHGF